MKSKIPIDLADGHLVLHKCFKQKTMLQTDVKLLPSPPSDHHPSMFTPWNLIASQHYTITLLTYSFYLWEYVFLCVCICASVRLCVFFVCA